MTTFVVCLLCEDENTRFMVPNDFIGLALMKQHIDGDHGLSELVDDSKN